MDIIEGDILDVKKGIICHQVNCKGVMGAGLAKSIRDKYPDVYRGYKLAYKNGKLKLGKVIVSKISDDLVIANLCSQDGYGRDKHKRYTDYVALVDCLIRVRDLQRTTGLPVYIPYGMSCGLAGGDWDKVSILIEDLIPDSTVIKYNPAESN